MIVGVCEEPGLQKKERERERLVKIFVIAEGGKGRRGRGDRGVKATEFA